MPEMEKMPNMGPNIPPMSPEDAVKMREYEKGKKITMKDGSVRTVYSVKEEMDARAEDREREFNV